MLGYISGFDIEEYKGIDLIYQCVNNEYGGVKAYFFEVDGDSTIYIEDYTNTWNILVTINATPTATGFQAYSGTVTPTSGATMSRIRFTGTYFYRTINRGIFNYPVQTAPEYMPWVKIDLPNDVKKINKVITEYPQRQYEKDSVYKIEREGNTQSLYINYYYDGKIRTQYKPIPTEITVLDDTIEIDDITAQLIAYELAAYFMAAEQNQFLTSLFRDKYNILKVEITDQEPSTVEEIIDVYESMGWGD